MPSEEEGCAVCNVLTMTLIPSTLGGVRVTGSRNITRSTTCEKLRSNFLFKWRKFKAGKGHQIIVTNMYMI